MIGSLVKNHTHNISPANEKMAEIKSTMELVMERAARFGKASPEELAQEEGRKLGMQLSASYLDGSETSLVALLEQQDPAGQMTIRHGMLDAMLRNIALARDEHQLARVERALNGLVELGGNAGDLRTICGELQQIISQYGQHREQLQGRLEEQVRMQYEQVLAQQTGMDTAGLNIDPTMQPKFKEEWGRIEAELVGQYGQALEQHKTLLTQRLGV